MICGTFTLNNVPDNEVANVVAGFNATVPPPTTVTPARNADATWTVVATYPACPPDMTHNTAGTSSFGATGSASSPSSGGT
jgi:hypothetical protein